MTRRDARCMAMILLTILLAACGLPIVSSSPSDLVPTPGGSGATLEPSTSADAASSAPGLLWVQIAATTDAPAARSGHTWTVDPDLGLAYLFGGQDASTVLGDLWAYDLAADGWERISGAGPAPAPRTGHVAAWLDGVGLVVMGGRARNGEPLDDLWRFDPETGAWEAWLMDGTRPPARSAACAVTDPTGRLWLTHGLGAGDVGLEDTWSLDPRTATWSNGTPAGGPPAGGPPEARAGAACWWAGDNQLVVFGGRTSPDGALGDLWTLSTPGSAGATWTLIDAGTVDLARSDGAAIRHGDRLIVVGGLGTDGLPALESVGFDAMTLASVPLASVEITPTARSSPAIVDDPAAERLLLVGGATAAGPSDEVWQATLP